MWRGAFLYFKMVCQLGREKHGESFIIRSLMEDDEKIRDKV